MRGTDDQKRFSVVMFWLAARMITPGGKPKDVDAALQADYFEALRDIAIEKIEWGAKRHFATEKWFPMPGELRVMAMSAPATVLPQPYNPLQITEITKEQAAANREKLSDMVSWFEGFVEERGK